jgi:antitoxin HigA-1
MSRMKNPAHPGEIVAETLAELRVTVVDAAKALGVTRQHLHSILSGKTSVTAEMAVRLEAGLGSTAETWLAIQAAYDLARVQPVKVERLKEAA